MSVCVSIKVDGVNCAPEKEDNPMDMNCPEIGSGINYWKDSCNIRNRVKARPTCCKKCEHGIKEVKEVKPEVKGRQGKITTPELQQSIKDCLDAGMTCTKTARVCKTTKSTVAKYRDCR
ncbi:MAG: hypothetical protein PF440_06565 [Thiomicrorhabdus sp.]|jgi:hypothetical protein|nr:hypothetical protein [Thiomicrorhabdus sp.]